jgi:hypothetical protein
MEKAAYEVRLSSGVEKADLPRSCREIHKHVVEEHERTKHNLAEGNDDRQAIATSNAALQTRMRGAGNSLRITSRCLYSACS